MTHVARTTIANNGGLTHCSYMSSLPKHQRCGLAIAQGEVRAALGNVTPVTKSPEGAT